MRLIGRLAALAVIAVRALLAQPTSPPAIVIKNATLIDGVAPAPMRDASILIQNGRIERIVRGALAGPPGAVVIDLRGRWLLPGLIDAHAHLDNIASARAVVAAGVTTARSLGVDHFADVGLRELHRRGRADIPDVIASGYHVRPRPADALFLNAPELADIMPEVAGPESVRRMVRVLIDRGADVIKVMATERAGMPEHDPEKRMLSDVELAAAVEEATKAGRPVAAHAHGDEGAAAAVRAGAATIEHGTYLSDATLALMKERGTCLVPTIATVIDMSDPGGDYDNSALYTRGQAMLPRVRDAVARARTIGVRSIAGTDTRYTPRGARIVQDELVQLVQAGASPFDALRAATSVSAECLGLHGRTGSLREGLEADLIAVGRDPLADIEALRDIVLVVNDGRVAVNRIAP